MRANEFIAEVFDKPLAFSIDSYGDGHFDVGNVHYDVEFIEYNKDNVEIIFSAKVDDNDSTLELTGTGNEFVVFSTIAKIVFRKFNEYRPNQFKFSADLAVSSRAKLYNRFAKLLAQKLNYSLELSKTPKEMIYYFRRNDQ